jgi:biotin transport system substrate-specific component
MMSYSLSQSRGIDHRLKDVLLVSGASLMIPLFGMLSIPLPFTPIPIATQMNFCLFLGVFLGSRRGGLAVLFFLLEGAMGFPVFSGGMGGLAHLLGPRGGYLFGYLIATCLTGLVMEKAKEKTRLNAFVAMALGNLAVYLFGYAQLSLFLGIKTAFLLGVLPFILGDLFKLLITAKCIELKRSFQKLS